MAKAPEERAPVRAITQDLRQLAALTLDPKNVNTHTTEQIADIAASLKRFGYLPTIAVRPNGQLIAGEGTLKGLLLNGTKEATVIVVAGLSEPDYAALALALNKLPEGSSFDPTILRDTIAGLSEIDDGLVGVGFSDAEVDDILAEPDEIEVKAVATTDVNDEFWISIRGPLADQALVLQRMEEATKDLPGVNVELGTINIG